MLDQESSKRQTAPLPYKIFQAHAREFLPEMR